MPSTPLRDSTRTRPGRAVALRSPEIEYADGSEEALLGYLRAASDLGSLSDELEEMAGTWAERYHLSRGRANIVRALDLAEGTVVLEVGAGCGAVTRYLGETCSLVDAVEPVRSRAAVAAERTRDLPNVQVFAGTVEDVPAEPVYDLIVLVGVLEYVAAGGSDMSEYVAFLASLRKRLLPEGRIVCAIENQLGVKYLSGAPEDHSGRPFDGLEDYPVGGPARTFSRARLAALFEEAGLHPVFLHAFPDYKICRLVYSDALLSDPATRDLAWRIPQMPSPDWDTARPRLASEGHLWRSLVQTGLGGELANSFVVVAGSGDTRPLWPDARLAIFFNTQRRAAFATRTDVTLSEDDAGRRVRFLRGILGTTSRTAVDHELHMEVEAADLVPGRDLVDVLAGSTDEEVAGALAQWRDLASARQAGDAPLHVDFVPHNIVVSADGHWHAIDQEWSVEGAGLDYLLARGVFWLGVRLAEATPPQRWPEGWRTRDLVVQLGEWIALDPAGTWLEAFLDREALLQATVNSSLARGSEPFEKVVAAARSDLGGYLDRLLDSLPLGRREQDLRRDLERHLQVHDHMLWTARQQLDEVGRLAHERGTELAELQQMLATSRGWKLANRLDRLLQRLRRG